MEQRFFELLREDLQEIKDEVKSINKEGCAKRNGDVRRIEGLEKGQSELSHKLDKLFYTTLATAVGIIAFLLKAFLPYILK